jgi:hypothetical protein
MKLSRLAQDWSVHPSEHLRDLPSDHVIVTSGGLKLEY